MRAKVRAAGDRRCQLGSWPVLLGFDFTSWYAVLVYIAGAYLLWRAFAGQVVADARAVRRRVKPEPPELPIPPPVSIGEQIGASISYAQDQDEAHRHLASIRPTFEIRNDVPDYAIRDVTTGVRRSDRAGDHQFNWHAHDIPPLTHRRVDGIEIPPGMFRDVHESVAQEAFVFWARFLAAGGRWEITRDAQTKQTGERWNPPPLVDWDTSSTNVKP